MMFSRKLLLLLGIILLFQFRASAQYPNPYRPEVRLTFRGVLAESFPSTFLNGHSNLPAKYFTGIYRMPAMGLRFYRQEVLISPVFIYLPKIFTVGSRGMMLHYRYDITNPDNKNVLFAGASLMYASIVYYYHVYGNYEYNLQERTYEGSVNVGFRHNLSDHFSATIFAGTGMRSTKVQGYNRPFVHQLGITAGYTL